MTVETIAWHDAAPIWSCDDAFELRQLGGMPLWTRRLSDLMGGRKLQLEGARAAISFILPLHSAEISAVTSLSCHLRTVDGIAFVTTLSAAL